MGLTDWFRLLSVLAASLWPFLWTSEKGHLSFPDMSTQLPPSPQSRVLLWSATWCCQSKERYFCYRWCVCLPHSARFSSQLLCKKLCLVPCVCGCVCVLEGCWPCWTPLMKHCHSVDILWNATEIMQFWTRAYYDYCWMFKVKQVKSASEYSLASWF